MRPLEHGLALLVYGALALLALWPLPTRFATAYPAAPGEGTQDLWQNLWNLWWVAEALRRGVSPLFTDALFYPRGASLLFHPLDLTSGVLALPLRALAGQVVAYNALVLLSFVLSGYAVFLLARRHGCGGAAALLGGLAYSAATYHFFHLRLGHLEQISMHWLPLYALALDTLLRRPAIATVLAATLALLAVIFTSLYMALYAALLTGLWAAWAAVGVYRRSGRRGLVRPAGGLAALLTLTLLVVGPTLLIPMAREAGGATYMVRSLDDAARGAAAPADALLPPAAHPIRALLQLPEPRSGGAFLGYVALALAGYGLVRRPATAGRWVALALLAWLLSLGPALPLYRLLYELPPLRVARYPDRFALLALLGVAVAAAIGADALLAHARGRPIWARGAAALLCGLLLWEHYPGAQPLAAPIDDPFYHQLAGEPGRFSVLELPINRANNSAVDMAAQTIHGHAILDGMLAREVPRIPFEWLPLVRDLERPDRLADIVAQPAAARVAALRFFDLRYLIYHRADENGPVTPPTAAALARAAGVPVSQVYADDQLVAYRLAPPEGPPALAPIVALGEGWYNQESSSAGPQRWLRPEGGTVQVYAPSDQTATLRLKLLAYRQPRQLGIYLDQRLIAQVEAQPWLAELRSPPVQLTAGIHTLGLVASEPGVSPRSAGEGDDDRPLTVAVFELAIEAQP